MYVHIHTELLDPRGRMNRARGFNSPLRTHLYICNRLSARSPGLNRSKPRFSHSPSCRGLRGDIHAARDGAARTEIDNGFDRDQVTGKCKNIRRMRSSLV